MAAMSSARPSSSTAPPNDVFLGQAPTVRAAIVTRQEAEWINMAIVNDSAARPFTTYKIEQKQTPLLFLTK